MKLEPGDSAPDFALKDDHGQVRRLSDFAGQRLVLYFYPAAFTPGCTVQACDFRDNHEAFAEAGYQVIGISPDDVPKLAAFRDEHGLPFPLLADTDHKVAEAYGAWGPRKAYGREYVGIVRSTVTIGPEGLVENAWYSVRAKGHVDRVSEELLS